MNVVAKQILHMENKYIPLWLQEKRSTVAGKSRDPVLEFYYLKTIVVVQEMSEGEDL